MRIKQQLLFTLASISFFQASVFATELTPEQMTYFTQKCVQCHVTAETGAPIVGDAKSWQPVLKQGLEQTLKNVIHGKAGMPPLGSCSGCTEQDFRALIKFMAGFKEKVGNK